MAVPGSPQPADVGPRRIWLVAVVFGLVSSVVLGATVVLVTRSSDSPPSGASATVTTTAAPTTAGTGGALADTARVAGRVVLVGDSITEQSEGTFEEVLGDRWSLWIDGVGGATVAQQVPAAERAVDEAPEQVVVNLGTNDIGLGLDPSASVARVRDMLDLFPGATCLHVVTVAEGMSLDGDDHRADAAAFNDGLRSIAAADPRVTVIDWDAALDGGADDGSGAADLVHDTVHPTEQGERVLAELYASALSACPVG